MADKKKLSVAEILAAARKTDAKGDAVAPASAVPKSDAPPADSIVAETQPNGDDAQASPAAEPPKAKPAVKPKPATAGGRMSVAEMMAAARAEKEKGAGAAQAKPAAAPKPAAKAPAAKPAAAAAKKESPKAAPVGGPKETASILAAARTTVKPGPMSKSEAALKAPAKPVAAKEEKAKRPVPPMPVKPEYAKPKPPAPKASVDESRRGFLFGFGLLFGSSLAVGFTSLAATMGLWTLGTARFMFPNILTEPPSKFKVGFPSSFSPGQVETKFIPQFGVWVVNWEYNGQPQIYALRSVCTHLGCTPNWLEGEQKFKCPCHGSGFYKDGINFEGPAPRPLERYAIHLADDGQLEIDKSKIFQEEMGQWSDASCYVPV